MSVNISWLEDRINGRINGTGAPVIIDGGMGTELEKSGVPMDDQVWSGRSVISHPEAVLQVHEAFITAGAEVIITNTFAAAGGLGDYVRDINLKAVKLAQQARDSAAQAPVAIAGSICEWAPTDDPKWHQPEAVGRSTREQAEILVEAGVDLIALEMCEQSEFSIAAIDAIREFDIPVWIGMSARRHRGCSTLAVFDDAALDFEGLVKALSGYPAMMMNIMHTPVPDVDEALTMLQRYWNGPVGVYPESGYFTMPNWQFVDVIKPDEFAEVAERWVDSGVRMVGGCCGLGPEHIAVLRQALK
jgi:homocysteine S-methyltransferase